MKGGMLIVCAVAVMAATVLLVSGFSRSAADRSVAEVRVAGQLREAMLTQELALDQALAGLGPGRLVTVERARQELVAALGKARSLSRGSRKEVALIEAQLRTAKDWQQRADDEIADVREGRVDPAKADDDRVAPFQRYLAANDRFRAEADRARRRATRRAEVLPIVVVVILAALFMAGGAVLVRRDRRTRQMAGDAERRRRTDEETFQTSQRRLSEALQAAVDQPEAHALVKQHLQQSIPGAQAHILNRNNSADRLEPSTALEDASPLGDALRTAEPRSCIAVRLSREFARNPDAVEVLECELCGRLEGESVCRPLLVGGEVIGSVLLQAEAALLGPDRRRIEESVTAAAPVLANLRNLAIAEVRAATDALTGLPNRRSVDDSLKRMLAQAGRSLAPLAVLQLDLDHFKEINDRFGHDRGDAALAGFGALLRSQLRAADFAGRSGGEEFIVLLPDTDRAGGLKLAEKLRHAVGGLQVDGVDRRVTTSIGLAVYPDDATEEAALMRLADRALYSAKQAGRDRVETVSTAGLAQADALPRP